MDDVKGSNAIVALVSAYADALAGARDREAQQAALVARLSKELEPLRVAARLGHAAAPLVATARTLVRLQKVPLNLLQQLRDELHAFDDAVDGGCVPIPPGGAETDDDDA